MNNAKDTGISYRDSKPSTTFQMMLVLGCALPGFCPELEKNSARP